MVEGRTVDPADRLRRRDRKVCRRTRALPTRALRVRSSKNEFRKRFWQRATAVVVHTDGGERRSSGRRFLCVKGRWALLGKMSRDPTRSAALSDKAWSDLGQSWSGVGQ